jgi:hypothetical protein
VDSLRHVYEQAITEKFGYPRGWMANWPLGLDQRLGQVGTVGDDGESFNQDGVLADYGITASGDPDADQPDGPWEYTSNHEISIGIETNASLPGWEWIANAKAGLKCGFSNNGGLVLAVGGSRFEKLANLDGLRSELLEAANAGRMRVGQAVVVQQQIGDTGLVITSEGSSGELAATTNFDVGGAGKPTLASFGADFHLKQQSASVAHNSFPSGFSIAFRLIKLGRRGWFWWKHITIEGIRPIGPDDEEMLLGPDDYFAPLPDADFSMTS